MLRNLLAVLLLAQTCNTITEDQLFPFGPQNGDRTEFTNDDRSESMPLSINLPFYGQRFDRVWIETNGILTFSGDFSTFTPQAFPLSSGVVMLACYWTDVDTTRNPGRVYYREVTQGNLLDVASSQVRQYFKDYRSFRATWLFIATWYNVTFFGGNSGTPTNTFQAVVASDGNATFALYNYLKIVWTTGTASGGDAVHGLGGTPAQVGFDAGDGMNYLAIPESRTGQVVNVDMMTNLQPPMAGRYGYIISDAHIVKPMVHLKTCQAITDPHFSTFDGAYYSPQTPVTGLYLASAPTYIPDNTVPWSVYFGTTYWHGSAGYTCVNRVLIYADGQTVLFGMSGELQINGIRTAAPWYYPNRENATVSVTSLGRSGHLLVTADQVRVQFTGEADYKMTIMVPWETYNHNLTGYCGNMNNDSRDEPQCTDGQHSIDQCWPWPPATTTQQPSPRTTPSFRTTTRRQMNETTYMPPRTTAASPRPSTRVPPRTTTDTEYRSTSDGHVTTASPSAPCSDAELEIVKRECKLIIDTSGPFADCAVNASALAQTFYASCVFDLCVAKNDTNLTCTFFESYAEACMQELPGVVLHWRSEKLCPPSCPANMHYDDCAPSCPKTCGDPDGPLGCTSPCHGDCVCNGDLLWEHNQCVEPEKCGCHGSDGSYHRQNDTWVLPDCTTECTCSSAHISCHAMRPCPAHSQCRVNDGRRACFCDAGYTGDGERNCTKILECASHPCKNGGTCIDSPSGGHRCVCPLGYSGPDCAEHSDPCSTRPCAHGGTCTPSGSCVCPAGFSGDDCRVFDCRGRRNGDYADPEDHCASHFFTCSNGYVYRMPCAPATPPLVFVEDKDACLYRYQVPGCQ